MRANAQHIRSLNTSESDVQFTQEDDDNYDDSEEEEDRVTNEMKDHRRDKESEGEGVRQMNKPVEDSPLLRR
jgi:hypothetical protein